MENILESFVASQKNITEKEDNVTQQHGSYIGNIGGLPNENEMTKVVLVLPMQCEWQLCNICFTSINAYQMHTLDHLNELTHANQISGESSC